MIPPNGLHQADEPVETGRVEPLAGGEPLSRLQAVIDLLPTAIWIAEGDHIRYANAAAARLLNVASGQAIAGSSVRSMINSAAHAGLKHQIDAVLAQPGALGTLRATLRRPDLETCDVEIALTALPDHGRTTVQMVIHDVTRRQRELQELQASRQALRRLSARIVEEREAERRRIARELHDELGQGLSALKLELASCDGNMPASRQHEHRLGMMKRLDEIMSAVRRIAIDLRPQMLDDLGLGAAVEWLVQDFARNTGLRCTMQLEDVGALDDRAGIALYRMVQEALTNVLRHARASEVHVDLRLVDGQARLSVRDNGVGVIDGLAPRESQFGLLGMRERADMLGGDFQFEAVPGGGTCVCMQLPLEPRPVGKRP
ncbi:MAG: hypothetical protein C0505_07315 [Leptothrix sp. (in: Bacteria)]|nr:hypothetical protein [Leptothrix sp. (in: b-proteobacteria)]